MPVHHAQAGPVLVLAVDGDFTADELGRVLGEALAEPETPNPTRVLLDLSGSASLAGKDDDELARTAGHFAVHEDRLGRVAILIPGDLIDHFMRLGTAFAAQQGIKAAPFRTREEAEEWLREHP
jgi:hypothetical protein